MKRLLVVVLVLAMVLSFAACGGASEEVAETAPAAEEEAAPAEEAGDAVYTIAVVPKDSTNPWFVRMEEGVTKYAADSGQNAFQKGPAETDAAQQVQVVEDLIAQGVDALCVVPHDPGAMEPVLKKALDKGIVVVTHEASFQENTMYDIEAFNNGEYGGFIMDQLAEAMGEEGEYICMVGSVTNASHNEWADGAIARQKEAYPNMTLIEERIETEDNPEVAYERAKEIIKNYPNIKGIVGTSSFDAPGAARAIEELGKVGEVFTCGTGMPAANKEILEKDLVVGLTLWDPADAGYAMCVLAEKILNGEEIASGVNLGVKGYEDMQLDGKLLIGAGWVKITKENVDSFGF